MSIVWMLVIAALVLLVLAFVAGLLGRRRGDLPRRDPRGRKRDWESPHRRDGPHLESRDEYEVTHDTGSPHLESRCEYEQTQTHVPA